MTNEMIDLAHRVIACKNWRWFPGMRAIGKNTTYPVRFCDYGERVFDIMDLDEIEWWQQPGGKDTLDGGPYPGPYLPDLADPATLGCLLQLVREAYADQCACVFPIDYGPAGVMWQVRLTASGRQVTARHYTTEAEALVAALERTS